MAELFGQVVAVAFHDDPNHQGTFLKDGAPLCTIANWDPKWLIFYLFYYSFTFI